MTRFVSRPFVGFSLLYGLTWGVLTIDAPLERSLLGLALLLPLIWLSQRDLELQEIPDLASLTVALIGMGYWFYVQPQALVLHVASGLIVCAVFWGAGEIFYRLRAIEGLGIGDAKLLGALVVVLGPWRLPELLLLASLGGIGAILLAQRGRTDTPKGIPFGPFIAYAGFILLFRNIFFL